jgi:hypothetical protein
MCLLSRCLGMNVYSVSAIPAFRSYVTLLYILRRVWPCRILRTLAFSWFCITSACCLLQDTDCAPVGCVSCTTLPHYLWPCTSIRTQHPECRVTSRWLLGNTFISQMFLHLLHACQICECSPWSVWVRFEVPTMMTRNITVFLDVTTCSLACSEEYVASHSGQKLEERGNRLLPNVKVNKKKVKLSLWQGVEAHRFVRRRGSRII